MKSEIILSSPHGTQGRQTELVSRTGVAARHQFPDIL